MILGEKQNRDDIKAGFKAAETKGIGYVKDIGDKVLDTKAQVKAKVIGEIRKI